MIKQKIRAIFAYSILGGTPILVGWLSSDLANLIALTIGIFFILRANPEVLPGLLLLHVYPRDFALISDFASMERTLISGSQEPTIIPNFSEISYILVVGFLLFKIIFSKNSQAFSRDRLFLLWLGVLPLALAVLFESYIAHNEMWSRGFRSYLISGCFFYGTYIGLKGSERETECSLKLISGIACAAAILSIILMVFWSHLVFWFISVASASLAIRIIEHRRSRRTLAIVLFSLSLFVMLRATLTIILICTFAIVFTYFLYSGTTARRGRFRHAAFFGIISAPIIFLAIVVGVRSSGASNLDVAVFDIAGTDFGSSRVMLKIFSDRLPIWLAAVEQFISGNLLVPVSGRPISLTYFGDEISWVYGSHNSIIEVFRNTGLVVGLAVVVIFTAASTRVVSATGVVNNLSSKVLSVSVIATFIAGFLLGDFLIDLSVGTVFWTIAGLLVGYSAKIRRDQFVY